MSKNLIQHEESREPQARECFGHRDDIIELCATLASEENLQVTFKEAAKGAVLTGFGALLGGLLAGPIGLAIGGSAASITAAVTCKEFKPVVQVIQEMSPEQKRKLSDAVKKVLGNVQPGTVFALIGLVTKTSTLKEAVIMELSSFLLKELSMTMIR